MPSRSDVLIEFEAEHRIVEPAIRGFHGSMYADDLRQAALLGIWEVLTEHDVCGVELVRRARCIARFRAIERLREIRFGPRKYVSWRRWIDKHQMRGLEVLADRAAVQEPVDTWAIYRDEVELRLSTLKPRFRDAVRPHFLEGLTVAECAGRVGWSVSYLHRLIRATRVPQSRLPKCRLPVPA